MFCLETILIILSIIIIITIIVYKFYYSYETFENYSSLSAEISDIKNIINNIQDEIYQINKYKTDTYDRFSKITSDIDKNTKNVTKVNSNFNTYESVFNKYIEEANIPVDTLYLCNKEKKCVEMKYDDDNEYNIKSSNIKIKNDKDEIITNFKDNEIYFGGNQNSNSPLYIKNNNVYSNKFNVSDLYIKDYKDTSKLLYLNDYIKWIDDSISYNNNMNKLSQDNNNKRITDITKINTKINNLNKDKDNLDAKITNNAKEISDLKMEYQNYKDLNAKFSNKYDELQKELNDNIDIITNHNATMQQYEQNTNKEVDALNTRIDEIIIKINELLEKASLQREVFNKANLENTGVNPLFDRENLTLDEYKDYFDKLVIAAVNLGLPEEELKSSTTN
jgi:chromosome segregation ATPase